jgi:hypothetical protein
VTGGQDTSELVELVDKEGAVVLAAALKKHETAMSGASANAVSTKRPGSVGLFMQGSSRATKSVV